MWLNGIMHNEQKNLGNINDFVKELRLEYPDIGAEKAEKIYIFLSDHHNYHVC